MATTNTVTDEYVLRTKADDQLSGAVETQASKLDAFEAKAQAAAAAATAVGQAATDTGAKITQAASSFDRVVGRYDSVTQAANRLAAAQRDLQGAMDAGQRALANGSATQQEVDAVTASLAAKVAKLSDALGVARANAEASAAAQEAWNGQVAGGGNAIDDFSARLAANAQQARSATIAAQQAAQAQAAFNQALGVQGTSDADYAKRAEDVAAYGASLDALRAKFNPLFAASKQYEAALTEISQAEKVGAINANEAAAARESATAAFAKANAPLQAVKQGTNDVSDASGNAAFATRQLGVQFTQAISSIASGQPVLTTFVQQGHQVLDVAMSTGTGFGVLKTAAVSAFSALTSPLGLAVTGIAAVSAAVVVLGASAESTSRQLLAMQTSLRATRDDYAAMGAEAIAAGKAVAASTGFNTADAIAGAKAITAVPNFTGTTAQLAALLTVAGNVATVLGVTLPQEAQVFAQAMTDPAKAAQDMADKHLFDFTQALAKSITNMADAGDKAGAFGAFLDQLKVHTDGVQRDGLTPLQKALGDLHDAFTGAGTDGQSLADVLGTAVVDAAAGAVSALSSLVAAIAAARNIKPSGTVDAAGISQYGALDGVLKYFGIDLHAPSTSISAPTSSSVPVDAAGIPQYGLIDGALRPGPNPEKFMELSASIQPAISYSAAVNGIDPELLARLQLAEGQQNPDGTWANNGSHIGAMQVGTSTFAGMQAQPSAYPTVADLTDLSDPAQNAVAGGALFGHLLAKYGDVRTAILAYHDGEPLMDKVLAGGASNSQAALDEASKIMAGYTGTGGKAITAGGGIPDASLPVPPIPPAGGDGNGVTNAMSVEDAMKLADGLNVTGKAANDAWHNIQNYQNALDVLTRSGAGATDEAGYLREAIADAQSQFYNAVPAVQATTREIDRNVDSQTQLAAAWAKGTPAVTQATAGIQAQAQALSDHLVPGTQQYATAVALLTQKNLDLFAATGATDIQKQITQTNEATDAQLKINAAYDGTAESLSHAQNEQKAYADAVQEKLIPGTQAFTDAVAGLTAAYDRSTAAAQQLQQEQASVSALAGSFSQAFDTIGNAISQAFVQGQGAAVNWGNVTSAVISQVIQQVIKLAVINPVLNSLFGQNNGTLATAFAVLGNSGGGASVSGGSGGIGTAISGVGTASSISGAFGGPTLLSSLGITGNGGLLDSLGLTGGSGLFSGLGGIGSSITGFLNGGLFGTSAAAAAAASTNAAISSLGAGVYGPATASSLSANSIASTGLFNGATVGQLLGGLGLGFGAGSLLNSLIGGNSTNGTIGSGLGAAGGAAIGSFVPGVGTVLGGLLGGLLGGGGGGLIGPHPANPYTSEQITVDPNGQLALGRTAAQMTDNSQEIAQAQADITAINQYLSSVGLTISNTRNAASGFTSAGTIFQIGSGGPSTENKFDNVAGGFSELKFSSSDPLLNSQVLQGKSYASLTDLQNAVTAFQQAEAAVSTFLDTTAPSLTTVGKTSGTLTDQLAALNNQYDAAIEQAKELANSNAATADQTAQLVQSETDLANARDKATAAAQAAIDTQTWNTDVGFEARYLTAAASISGSPTNALNAQLYAFDNATAPQQRQQLSDTLVGIYGDSIKSTSAYAVQMADLEHALGEERLAIVAQYDNQITAQQQAAAQAQAQATNAAAQAVSGVVTSITSYVQKLQTGTQSALSPTAQYSLESSQFNAVLGAAQAGDFNSLSNLTSYADAFLQTSQVVNGSGAAYAADLEKVVTALQGISNISPDTLTASAMAAQTQAQTATLVDNLQQLKTVMNNVLLQLRQGGARPAALAA